MRFAMRCCPVMLVAGTLATVGCSGVTTAPFGIAGPSTQFVGNVMGSEGIGTIAITVATPSPAPQFGANATSAAVSASGVLRLRSGFQVVDLIGSYDPSTQALVLSGSEWSVRGTLSGDILRGSCTVTSGSGVFVAQQQGAGVNAVTTFCGVFETNAGLGIRGESVEGVVQWPKPPDYVTLITFSGSYSPADSSLVLVNPANPAGPPLGTGRLRTNAYATWARVRFVFEPGDTCDWSGYAWQ